MSEATPFWVVPVDMLARAHEHIARLRGCLVAAGQEHIVRESLEALPEVGEQMARFATKAEPPLSSVLRELEQRTMEALHARVTKAELAADTARVALHDLSVVYAKKAVELRDMTEANAKNSAELHLVNGLLAESERDNQAMRKLLEKEFGVGI